MAHPYHHALSSARKHGGRPEDYQPIHDWFDESKAFLPDFRHRALRHHAEGIFLCERVFGTTITNSDGKEVPVRFRLAPLHPPRSLDDAEGRGAAGGTGEDDPRRRRGSVRVITEGARTPHPPAAFSISHFLGHRPALGARTALDISSRRGLYHVRLP